MSGIDFITNYSGSLLYELQNNGTVLVLKDALFNPATQVYHDIKLVRRGYRCFGIPLGGGGKFTGITEEVARQIQKTYGIVLKTLDVKPGEARLFSTPQKTTYYTTGFNRFWGQESYPFGQKEHDVLLSKNDAAFFGSNQMTVHDAIATGILRLVGNDGASINAAAPSADNREEEPKEDEKLKKPLTQLPRIPVYSAGSTPYEAGYDSSSFEERKKRMVAHLDRSGPIPFSVFLNQNRDIRIEDALLQRMRRALERLAENPKVNDSDAKYMKKLLKHWFRAAYHYLDKNSKPGDGYPQIFNEVNKKIKTEKKAMRKAKELYWRRHATLFWITLIDLFALKKIGLEPLLQEISKSTSLNPWKLIS
ncbi:MAG TPA: hypothetical protein VLE95_03650 [Chlamydiales bacterium]|nr:hypothetical protein [Chlamydiales bacterium]